MRTNLHPDTYIHRCLWLKLKRVCKNPDQLLVRSECLDEAAIIIGMIKSNIQILQNNTSIFFCPVLPKCIEGNYYLAIQRLSAFDCSRQKTISKIRVGSNDLICKQIIVNNDVIKRAEGMRSIETPAMSS